MNERVPIITSPCISVRFKANMIGVAPTRSPGSFRMNLHRGLPIVGIVASSTGVVNSCPGCTNVSEFRTQGTVMTSLRRNNFLIGVRRRTRGMNAYCHYNAAVRPEMSLR